MRTNTRTMALAAIFAALTFLLGMTPIGLIPLGFINLTIVHIPVIVGTMVLGIKTGILLGACFGIASTLAAFGMSLAAQSGLAATLLGYNPFIVVIMCVIPRLMIPIVTHLVYSLIKKFNAPVAAAVGAIAGSLTNTVLYLGIMGGSFYLYGIWSEFAVILTVTMVIAASCEAAAAAIISTPVVASITKYKSTHQ